MEFLTPQEVADRLKVSMRWVRDHREELGGIQLGGYLRFTVDALEENVRRIAAEQAEASLRPRPNVRPLGESVLRPRLSKAAVSEILRDVRAGGHVPEEGEARRRA